MPVLSTDGHAGEVVAQLARLGVAQPDQLCSVTTVHGRALCYQLDLGGGERLFVKQARPGGEAGVVAEARLLRSAGELVPGLPAVRLLALDDTAGLAVYEGLQHWRPLISLQLNENGAGTDIATALGRMLATVHVRARDRAASSIPEAGPFGRSGAEPWFAITPRSLAMYPAAYRELWVRLGAQTQDALAELADGWRSDCLIHADIKSDNIYVHPDRDDRAVLVDWETAGWGDPLWDLGSIVGDVITIWLHTLDLDPGGSLSTWLASAPTPLSCVAVYLRAAMEGYAVRSPLSRPQLISVVRYAGAYLALRALSGAMQAPRLTAQSHLTAHLARQFLLSPHTAQEVLL